MAGGGFYELFATPDDTSAQEQAQALQAVLRRNQQASTLAALSGAKSLQPFASLAGGNARQQEQMLGEAGKSRLAMAMELEKAKQAAVLRAQEKADDRAARSEEKRLDREARALEGRLTRAAMAAAAGVRSRGRDNVVQTDRNGNLVIVDKTTGEVTPAVDASGNTVQGRDRGLDLDTQKLGNDLQFITRMPQDLALLESYAGKTKPGVGPVRGLLPEWAISKEGVAVRKSVGRLLNALIYMSTGKQINEAEAARMAEAWLSKHSTDASIDRGVADLKDQLKAAAQNFYAKYEPRVLDAYGARGGFSTMGDFHPARLGTGAPPPSAPAAGPGRIPTWNPKTRRLE